jgi:hypothetical protein
MGHQLQSKKELLETRNVVISKERGDLRLIPAFSPLFEPNAASKSVLFT